MARPTEYTQEVIKQVVEDLRNYIAETEIPIFAEFCYKNSHTREYLYELSKVNGEANQLLSYAIKDCVTKKESELERQGLTGKINTTMAVFSLKQLGWKDKTESDVNLKGELKTEVTTIREVEVKSN